MVPSSGRSDARLMVVGEAPGETEERLGRPFCGASGDLLDQMLHEAKLMRSECFVTNVCRERPPGNKMELWVPTVKKLITSDMVAMRDKMVHPNVEAGWALLLKEISLVKPLVILCCGNVSMWALTGRWGIKSWRGSSMQMVPPAFFSPSPIVIPVYHPAYILRDWSARAITVNDLRRAQRILYPEVLKSTVPEEAASVRPGVVPPWLPSAKPVTIDTNLESITGSNVVPDNRFIIRPNYDQVLLYCSALESSLNSGPVTISCDIETGRGHIECIGLATSKTEAISIPFTLGGKDYFFEAEEIAIVAALKAVLTHPNARVIGQNFIYDSQYIHHHWGFVPNFARDTMLSHHCQFTELPKSLEYLSSMYCKTHMAWKWEVRDRSFKKDN